MAVSSTFVATIVQFVLGQECWDVEGFPLRALLQESAGKPNMDLAVPGVPDSRILEVVVDGLPLRGGAQLALDTHLCARCMQTAPPDVTQLKGMEWRSRRQSGRKWPLTQSSWARTAVPSLWCWRWRLGRRSGETRGFLSQLARARAREEVPFLRRRAEQAWRLRWGAMLGCAAAKAVASSLLNLLDSHGGDGRTPPTRWVLRVSCGAVGETWFSFL